MENDDLTPEEENAFKSLPRESNPPGSMEKRVMENLKAQGLVHSVGNRVSKWIIYPVAASLVFLLGFFIGNTEDPIDHNEAFMLILFEDESFKVENPTDVAIEYGLWNAEVNLSGIQMDGQELWNEAYQITMNGVEEFGAEHENRITGYFVFQASSTDEAIAIARESPHIKNGGTIQLKRFRVR